MCLVSANNEWDQLEEIIVGTSLNARLPSEDKGYAAIKKAAPDLYSADDTVFPQQIIDETEEDIAIFIDELVKLGIKVRRPNSIRAVDRFRTLDWEANHYFSYCPRDVLLSIGDSIIESPNVFRSRYFETFSYKNILIEYMNSGAKWISAPKPRLLDEIYSDVESNDIVLKNLEPVFDAANILKAGYDIFYLVSSSGNEMGLRWLQNVLGSTYRVHPCYNLYASVHIDTTLCLLRPGLALINPERVNEKNLPQPLKNWDILVAPEMVEYSYSNLRPLSSRWFGMNLLMLSPRLAVVDKHQTPLIKLLEKQGIDVLPLALRHGRSLGGGFHCITLDVRRKGELEDYFS